LPEVHFCSRFGLFGLDNLVLGILVVWFGFDFDLDVLFLGILVVWFGFDFGLDVLVL